MTFIGTLVYDLQSLVDADLKRGCICAICGKHYKKHSDIAAHCPNSTDSQPRFLQTRFTADT